MQYWYMIDRLTSRTEQEVQKQTPKTCSSLVNNKEGIYQVAGGKDGLYNRHARGI